MAQNTDTNKKTNEQDAVKPEVKVSTVIEQKPVVVETSECWITPNESWRSSIGGIWYDFVKGQRMKVNTEVRDILLKAGKIARMG